MKISEVIVVEGEYDKIRVTSAVDATVVVTNGFQIFSDREKLEFLRTMAKTRGLIVLTDSDAAGFAIRNFVKQGIDKKHIKHAYIPDIFGKEKRKSAPSKEGKLGVEGIENKIIIDALKKAGASDMQADAGNIITRLDLYNDGFMGGSGSAERRRTLLLQIGLPSRLSTNMLIEVINSVVTYEEYKNITKSI